MHRLRAGFTLIELLVVISILGLLVVTFLPDLLASRTVAYIAADDANQRELYKWVDLYQGKTKIGHLPTEGGSKFLIDLWVKGVCDHTVENFDRFFTPGLREQDPYYADLRKQLLSRQEIWTDLNSVTTQDTHYAARAKEHILGMTRPNEAWVANDNEGVPAFNDGTVNVLYSNGHVRPLTLQMQKDLYHWPGLEQVFPTFGPQSPDPDLQKLSN